jgi:hypothetical protein
MMPDIHGARPRRYRGPRSGPNSWRGGRHIRDFVCRVLPTLAPSRIGWAIPAHPVVLQPSMPAPNQGSKPSRKIAPSSNVKSMPETAFPPLMAMGVAVAVLIGLGEPQGRPK